MNQEKIGKFISECRKEKNYTQEELAEILGVSNRAVSKWENGRGMPNLSLFEPLCETLGITINELMSGERIIDETYQKRFEENIVNVIDYTNNKLSNKTFCLGIVLLVFGFLIMLTAISIFPPDSGWSSKYSVFGSIVALIGFSKLIHNWSYSKRVLCNFGFYICLILLLFGLDFLNVKMNEQPPRFTTKIITRDQVITYKNPFYNAYRINFDTPQEYFILDMKKQYTYETLPRSPFNRDKNGIEAIKKYQNEYVGNNSNTGNMIGHLPISELGYSFMLNDCNLIINYDTTDWYYNENMYIQKALVYNSVSIFMLIDNVEEITYHFSGSTYHISRVKVENNYPMFDKLKVNNEINEKAFNKFVENKMNDDDFTSEVFKVLFE